MYREGSQSYPPSLGSLNDFSGCVRNMIVNDEKMDLYTPSYEEGTTSDCSLWGGACDSNSVDSLTYCVHGECYSDITNVSFFRIFFSSIRLCHKCDSWRDSHFRLIPSVCVMLDGQGIVVMPPLTGFSSPLDPSNTPSE